MKHANLNLEQRTLSYLVVNILVSSADLQSQVPEKVAMQSEPCHWFLLNMGEDDFAIQYEGEDPDIHFPANLSGKLVGMLDYSHHVKANKWLRLLIDSIL